MAIVTKAILMLACVALLGCGATSLNYNPKTGEVHYWSGKEYKYFYVKYKDLEVIARDVDAFKGQALIKDTIVQGLKAASPIPLP